MEFYSFLPIGSSRAGHGLSSSCGSMTYSPVRLTLTLYTLLLMRAEHHTQRQRVPLLESLV